MDGPLVRLADFGHSSKSSLGISRYETKAVAGPEFLPDAPFSNCEMDGRNSDVYALGMLLYALLSKDGSTPMVADDMSNGYIGYGELLDHNDGGCFPLSDIAEVDQDGRDLLSAMTRVNPLHRIRIDGVKNHSFLRDV
ncbi:UNVERIFIED_CONTAM: hypothetical protein HDU68_000194 [Siphonaria sp. JEL0065]|nr:hypothetical protein HDU68_000194 [Siphonaria sp. JEL0065]